MLSGAISISGRKTAAARNGRYVYKCPMKSTGTDNLSFPCYERFCMMTLKDFRQIIEELLDELPEEFFRDLSGGVIVSEAAPVPDYARGNDLYTMGQYTLLSGMRQIVIYKGSFDRVHPYADAAEAKRILRGVVRHEFRHHLEFLGGVHNASSLEAQDEREKQAYLSRREKEKE